jgi:hypothetical protein
MQKGCFAAPGFVADVPRTYQIDDSAKFFLVHRPAGVPAEAAGNAAVGPLPDWTPAPEVRARIEQMLQARLKDDVAAVHNESATGYERAASAGADWKQWADQWSAFDARLARGEGRLDYYVQAFRLTPDGTPRLYVRARWTLDGTPAFLMTAWLRAEPTLVFQSVDTHTASLMRMGEMRGRTLGLDDLPTVLNVFDRRGDHEGELLLYSRGYEGFDIHLFRYTDTGPVPTTIAVGGGC